MTRKVRNSVIFWLGISLVLGLTGFLLARNEKARSDPAKLAERLTGEIRRAESYAGRFLEAASEKIGKSENPFSNPDALEGIREKGAPPLSLFVYRNDSLVYWSDRSTVLPKELTDTLPGKPAILHLPGGWYGVAGKTRGDLRCVAVFGIHHEFPFRNEYLNDGFEPWFGIPDGVRPEPGSTLHPVRASDDHVVFGLIPIENRDGPEQGGWFAFLVFVAAMLALFRALYTGIRSFAVLHDRPFAVALLFGLTVTALRAMQTVFRFPGYLYEHSLFTPAQYSSSAWIPSLGDLTLNAGILVLVATLLYLASRKETTGKPDRRKYAGLKLAGAGLSLGAAFHAVGFFLSDLVRNSSFSLNLQNISGLSAGSALGMLVLVFILLSLWFAADGFSAMPAGRKEQGKALLWLFSGLALGTTLRLFAGADPGWYENLFGSLLVTSFILIRARTGRLYSFAWLLAGLCLFALFATLRLNASYRTRETGQLQLMAARLASHRNPVTEVIWEQTEQRIAGDSLVKAWLLGKGLPGRPREEILDAHLKEVYLGDYWKKYQVQITFCDPERELKIQPQGFLVNCREYFREITRDYGEPAACPNLYFLDYGIGREYYLAVISPGDPHNPPDKEPAIMVEFNIKNAYPDPGYPGLLMDRQRSDQPSADGYSYAFYQKGKLAVAVGETGYYRDLARYRPFMNTKPLFREGSVIHFFYRINESDTLLISRPERSALTAASPFSYLVVLFALIAGAMFLVLHLPGRKLFPLRLRSRLQLAVVGMLVVTVGTAGGVQFAGILKVNAMKNQGSLRDKTYSILVEVQHKFGATENSESLPGGPLGDFLLKLSNVFFTDINVFNVSGQLVASSRPQIFEENLVSDRMHPDAFRALLKERSNVYIQEESIGKLHYSSAYVPVYNDRDRLLGFLHLPYFTRQDELRKEISSFLVAFLNVYILIILLGIFVIILISNYITAPLTNLAGKLSHLRLGGRNERIVWKRHDEIGDLVLEYNRMIDELERSAERLARSERESAWRQMARQVAHEIKNPLTPMKLSAQYLQKAWNERASDWDQRLERFTRTLVEQIDALSAIASDFSDFARMSQGVPERVDLREVVASVVPMYRDTTPIRILVEGEDGVLPVLADRGQIVRLLTNLINNAVQSIEDPDLGEIRIRLAREENSAAVYVSDNGCGIRPEQADRIFQPEFTTKTTGMGLGLAIVKAVVDGLGGTIAFFPAKEKGTTFAVKIPVYEGGE